MGSIENRLAEVEGKTRGAGQRCGELIGLYDYHARWYDRSWTGSSRRI